MKIALDSGRFRIGAMSYETELAVCPIAAAAKTAGVWVEGSPRAGGPTWGTEGGPSHEVEDFVAWFDIVAEHTGLDVALADVRLALSSLGEPATDRVTTARPRRISGTS
jgi:hypothetical protein